MGLHAFLIANNEGRKPLWRSRSRQEDVIVTNMTIARQRLGGTPSRSNEQTRKFIASQLLAKHTFQWQRIKQSNTQTAGDSELYSVRLEVSSVSSAQFTRKFNNSAFAREFSVQLWSVKQRTAEAEEVTDS
jgi:hypothetical protein